MAKQRWTIKRIKNGFDKFLQENGRLPTAREVDHLNYLPSSRWIEYKFGGLEKLRKELGYEVTHFGKGKFRQRLASEANRLGREAELELETFLRNIFGEVFVHTERSFDNTKLKIDFYIYSPDGNFGVDVFHTGTMRDFEVNINAKLSKYLNFPDKLYLVVVNDKIEQIEINHCLRNKKKIIPSNITILTIDNFKNYVTSLVSFNTPPGLKLLGKRDALI